jgi:hypothetical protein
MNNRLVQRKNITAAALQRFLAGPNKPKERNANKRINHLKEIITTAHGVKTNAATQNIADKTTTLKNLLAKNVKTMNYTVAGQHDTNVQEAYTAYTSAVNQGIGKLPNAARKLIAEQRAEFKTEVNKVRAEAAAKAAANKAAANKAAAEAEIAKILAELNTQIPAANATNVNANKYASLATAIATAKTRINTAAGTTGANKPNMATYERRLETFGNKISKGDRLTALQKKINALQINNTNATQNVLSSRIAAVKQELGTINKLINSNKFNNKLGKGPNGTARSAKITANAAKLAKLEALLNTKQTQAKKNALNNSWTTITKMITQSVGAMEPNTTPKRAKEIAEAAAIQLAMFNNDLKASGLPQPSNYITVRNQVANFKNKANKQNKFLIMGLRNYSTAKNENQKKAVSNYLAKKPTLANQAANRKTRAGRFGLKTVNKNLLSFFNAVTAQMKLANQGKKETAAAKAKQDKMIKNTVSKINKWNKSRIPGTNFNAKIFNTATISKNINRGALSTALKAQWKGARNNNANALIQAIWPPVTLASGSSTRGGGLVATASGPLPQAASTGAAVAVV